MNRGLDPCPSDNELLRMNAERGARRSQPTCRFCGLTRDQKNAATARGAAVCTSGCRWQDYMPPATNLETITEVEARVLVPPKARNPVTGVSLTSTIFRGALIELSGVVHGAPRTKKNHGRGVAKESLAYVRFRDAIIEMCLGKAAFPPVPLNMAAVFYTDNESSDLVGLLQGFCDALENAAVVPNDRWFMGFDGSRQIYNPLHPRIEFTIGHLK